MDEKTGVTCPWSQPVNRGVRIQTKAISRAVVHNHFKAGQRYQSKALFSGFNYQEVITSGHKLEAEGNPGVCRE